MTTGTLSSEVLRPIIFAVLLGVSGFFSAATRAEQAAVELDEYEGKVVLLDFWASWCVPCRQSFPWMQQMHDKYAKDGLVVIAVNLDNDVTAAELFLSEYPVDFDIVFDRQKSVAKQYGIVAMPSSIIIGRNGNVVTRHRGFKVKKQPDYERKIVAALEANDLVAENK